MSMRCFDPSWYGDTLITKTINVVAGVGTTGLFDPGNERESARVVIQIKKTGADDPTNVSINENGSGATWIFSLAGSLTVLNNYWTINSVDSRVTHMATDAMDIFTGSYPYIPTGFTRINVTDTAASDFTVYVHYLPRYM